MSNTYKVTWKATKDAQGYLIYHKGAKDSLFVYAAQAAAGDTTLTVSYNFFQDTTATTLPVKIIPFNKYRFATS